MGSRVSHTIAVIALSSFALSAQDTFVVANAVNWQSTLLEISDTGRVLTTIGVLPAAFIPREVVMAEDNRGYLALGQLTGSSMPGVILDVRGGITTTVVQTPGLIKPQVALRTSDGDWQVIDETGLAQVTVHRLRNGVLSPLQTVPWNVNGATLDEHTGQILIRGFQWGTPVSGYFRLDPNTGAVTTFVFSQSSFFSANAELVTEPVTGAVIDLRRMIPAGGTEIWRLHPTTGGRKFGQSLFDHIPHGIARASGRAHPVAYSITTAVRGTPDQNLIHVRADGTGVRGATFRTPKLFSSPFLRSGNRHLTWFLDALPNFRSLRVDFPKDAGRPYAVALSLAGPGVGWTLLDGRTIPIKPDALTRLCLTGNVGNVIRNTVGTLDPLGRARVIVNTNGFGNSLRGLRAWAAAVVFDPNSPSGIAHIEGPKLLEIKR